MADLVRLLREGTRCPLISRVLLSSRTGYTYIGRDYVNYQRYNAYTRANNEIIPVGYLVRSCNQDRTNLFQDARNRPRHNFPCDNVRTSELRRRYLQFLSIRYKQHRVISLSHYVWREIAPRAERGFPLFVTSFLDFLRPTLPGSLSLFSYGNSSAPRALSVGDPGEIYGFSSGVLPGALTIVVGNAVNSALRYVPAIADTLYVHSHMYTRTHIYTRAYTNIRSLSREDVRGRAGHARCGAPTR